MDYVFVVQIHKRDSLEDIFQLFSDIYQVRGNCHVFIMSNDANQLVQLREKIEELQKRIPYWSTEIFLKSKSKLFTCFNRFSPHTRLIWIDSNYALEDNVVYHLNQASLYAKGYGFISPYCEGEKYYVTDIYDDNPQPIQDSPIKEPMSVDTCPVPVFLTTISNYLLDQNSGLMRGIASRRIGFRNMVLPQAIVFKKENKNDTNN
jgi:hypothetical protein